MLPEWLFLSEKRYLETCQPIHHQWVPQDTFLLLLTAWKEEYFRLLETKWDCALLYTCQANTSKRDIQFRLAGLKWQPGLPNTNHPVSKMRQSVRSQSRNRAALFSGRTVFCLCGFASSAWNATHSLFHFTHAYAFTIQFTISLSGELPTTTGSFLRCVTALCAWWNTSILCLYLLLHGLNKCLILRNMASS